jgi:hypothetical protein
MPIMISANGAPAKMATVCRPLSPPNRRATAAAAPVRTPHMATFHDLGCRVPLEESIPITTEAASAPLIKKMPTSTIAMNDVTAASGNCSRVENNAASWLSATASAMFAPPKRSRFIAAPPKTANQTKLTRLGTSRTPNVNSLRVPRMPTTPSRR